MSGVAGLAEAAQSLRDMEAAVHRPPDAAMLGEYEDRPTKTARGAAGAARSTARHIETEQRRRDRINEGFKTLRELLPMQEKMDKANFLMSCVAYIRQLQAVMQQLLAMGAVGKLPEEMQWTVRMLLPRKDEPAAAAAKAAQAVAGPPALQFPGLQLNYLPQQAQGTAPDAAQLQSLLLAQQLQQQQQQQQQQQSATSMQNQLMQALQIQQLLQSAQQDLSGNNMLAQLAQQQPGMLATLGMLLPNLGAANTGNQAPQAQPVQPTAAGSCAAAAALEAGHILGGGNAPAKARKTTKVRRHTTAARLSKPPSPSDELATAAPEGRPLPGEIGS